MAVGLVLALAMLGGAGSVFPEQVVGPWSEWRDLPRLLAQSRSEAERAANLETQLPMSLARQAARLEIVAQVTEGRLSLLEAAVRFRVLNESAGQASQVHLFYSGQTAAERICRQVIDCTFHHLKFSAPEDAGRVVARLEAELEELLERHGTLNWPDEDPRKPATAATPKSVNSG